ncbi:universal stress protein [Spirosoma spitsbergense]|jgi:nucleotide-binding universal stress UspA family protein|uniref:universal stress protein n=1 Tax=Spirosoma spitsbergense TaxID=431554 RepID=UPI0003665FCE|nr:universal stress protein [Spirosoma spitsbergense]
MKKFLVTTDLSPNSKAALRFAGQLASQDEIALVILHVVTVMRPTSWRVETYAEYEKNEMEKARVALEHFIASVYQSSGLKIPEYTGVVENSAFTDSAIMDYAADHHVDYICVGTHGAGTLEKFFGTTTANLINQSGIPVIAVPGSYRVSKLTSILYASDLSRLEPELKQVVNFARPLAARVSMVHFSMPSEPTIDPTIIRTIAQTVSDYPVEVHVKAFDLTQTMITHIQLAVKTAKPSMIVLFTKQNEGFFYRLFSSGNAVGYSSQTTIPLLVWPKSN